ncbi:hypothetical protein [Bacteriophage sp.]|nr:hypothetical protein [Bacteriophage sp.]
MAQNVQPKADQPRVTTESLKRTEAPANLQYRVQGIKSFSDRAQKRSYGRELGRG